MSDYSIDPVVWFAEREISFTPKHFVLAHTPLTREAKRWIINNLRGRFSVVQNIEDAITAWDDSFGVGLTPAFEDPKEAMLYELTWSS